MSIHKNLIGLNKYKFDYPNSFMCYFDLKLYSKETLNQLFLNSFSSFGVFSFFLYKMFLYEKSQWFLYDCDPFLERHHYRFLAFQS